MEKKNRRVSMKEFQEFAHFHSEEAFAEEVSFRTGEDSEAEADADSVVQ